MNFAHPLRLRLLLLANLGCTWDNVERPHWIKLLDDLELSVVLIAKCLLEHECYLNFELERRVSSRSIHVFQRLPTKLLPAARQFLVAIWRARNSFRRATSTSAALAPFFCAMATTKVWRHLYAFVWSCIRHDQTQSSALRPDAFTCRGLWQPTWTRKPASFFSFDFFDECQRRPSSATRTSAAEGFVHYRSDPWLRRSIAWWICCFRLCSASCGVVDRIGRDCCSHSVVCLKCHVAAGRSEGSASLSSPLSVKSSAH